MSLIDELKRRNVFKVSVAYLVLGWFVLESSGTFVPALNLPVWTTSFLLWVGLAGLPFVVVFSWVFELTPEGLKRASEIDPGQSITQQTSKRLDYVIIAMLGLAMLMFAADRFLPRSEPPPAVAAAVGAGPARDTRLDAASTPDRAQGALLQNQDEPTPAFAPSDKSIAVLPFVNMSPDKDQEYFSDGMSEELLNLLAKAPDLKVIARTSSFAFKGKDVPIAEIAKQLNVAHVLEGSVRKAGNTVRITAQLIRAADSTHLWSETYDRPLDDIFKVQDEIAGAIAQSMQIRLAGGELSRRKGGTQNLEAYQLYLRSVSASNQNTKLSLDAASKFAEQAVKLDPDYGGAWMQLAWAVGQKTDNGFLGSADGYGQMRQMSMHALQISPDLADAHSALQYVSQTFDWDWEAAQSESKRALAIAPEDPYVLTTAASLSRILGRWDDAERKFRRALSRDPLSPYTLWNFGLSYYLAGRFKDSESVYRQLLEVEPNFRWTCGYLGRTLLAQGKAKEALAVTQQDVYEDSRMLYIPVVLQANGRKAEADEALQAQIAHWADTGAYFVAQTYAYRGDYDLALEWLDRAFVQRDAALTEILGEPLFKSIAKDPRFKAFLQKMNLPTEPVPVNWQ